MWFHVAQSVEHGACRIVGVVTAGSTYTNIFGLQNCVDVMIYCMLFALQSCKVKQGHQGTNQGKTFYKILFGSVAFTEVYMQCLWCAFYSQ